jgi:hypothetical protein
MQMQSDLKFSSCSFGRHPEEADTGMLPKSPLPRLTATAMIPSPAAARVRRRGRVKKLRPPKLCACGGAAQERRPVSLPITHCSKRRVWFRDDTRGLCLQSHCSMFCVFYLHPILSFHVWICFKKGYTSDEHVVHFRMSRPIQNYVSQKKKA